MREIQKMHDEIKGVGTQLSEYKRFKDIPTNEGCEKRQTGF